jgi:dTDP-4-dehydrorhamnose reductase
LRQCLRQPADAGLYHLAAAGETTWHGYANQVLDLARLVDGAIKLKANEVVPVPTSAFPTAARRPLNSRLDCQKLLGTFGLALPDWERGLGRMMGEVCL